MLLNKPTVNTILFKNINVHCVLLPQVAPHLSGNKPYKLWGYLQHYKQHFSGNIISSIGGSHSNHLIALAAAGKHLGYNTKGYILPQKTQSEVLQQCQNLGMQLSSLPYQEYKKYLQEKPSTLPPNEYFIPFGGSGELANIGLAQLAQQFNNLRLSTTMPLYLCAGTGTTALGLRPMLQNKMHIFMPFHKPLQSIISLFTNHTNCVFEIDNTKFGKVSPQIIEFCNYIYKTNSLQLDVVYTARLLQLIFNKINTYQIKSDVIMLHTGGLSGNLPHNTLLKY